ncbi:hypothetical protein IWW34DRAFT_767162, partial [Fusarium oxysporum f. sp. albedinis]
IVNSVDGASRRSIEGGRRALQLFQEDELPPTYHYMGGNEFTGYSCKHPGCTQTPRKTYKLPSRVTKHARNHYKPVICPICPERRAEQGDMKKHVQIYHRSLATDLGISGEAMPCPLCRCIISNSRKDNFKRHMRDSHGLERD